MRTVIKGGAKSSFTQRPSNANIDLSHSIGHQQTPSFTTKASKCSSKANAHHESKYHQQLMLLEHNELTLSKHTEAQIRRLSNPFNSTPTSETLLKFKVENSSFIPNTSIKMCHINKVGHYLDVDLVKLVKPKSRYRQGGRVLPQTDSKK